LSYGAAKLAVNVPVDKDTIFGYSAGESNFSLLHSAQAVYNVYWESMAVA
jgi:hypothetical protein